jgi:hypothetical protein
MKIRQKTIVPRNPVAVAASLRKAGAHETPEKVKRRDEKQRLRKIDWKKAEEND